jgi:hypothetical protein
MARLFELRSRDGDGDLVAILDLDKVCLVRSRRLDTTTSPSKSDSWMVTNCHDGYRFLALGKSGNALWIKSRALSASGPNDETPEGHLIGGTRRSRHALCQFFQMVEKWWDSTYFQFVFK